MTIRTNRPRILHVVDGLGVGGLELNLEALILRTVEDFEHHVCCVRRNGLVGERLAAQGIEIHELAVTGGLPWSATPALYECVRRLRPAVVHARNWGAIEAIPVARFGCEAGIVFGEHGIRCTPRVWRREWAIRRLSGWIDAFVAPSVTITRFLVECVGIEPTKIVQVDNGVDTQRFAPRPASLHADPLPESLRGRRLVVAVGRLSPVKRYDVLLRALARLVPARPDVGAVFVGDGPERHALETLARELGLGSQVCFVGFRDAVEEWMNRADVFVQTSVSEGACNAVLQAMACGKAVVASDIANHRDATAQGQAASLVPFGDIEALVEALRHLLDDEARRTELGGLARRTVLGRYTLDQAVAAYIDLYARVGYRRARQARA